MKLQITLDILELDEAMDYLEQVAPYAGYCGGGNTVKPDVWS